MEIKHVLILVSIFYLLSTSVSSSFKLTTTPKRIDGTPESPDEILGTFDETSESTVTSKPADSTPESSVETPEAPDETFKSTTTPKPADGTPESSDETPEAPYETPEAHTTPKPADGTPESLDETPEAPNETPVSTTTPKPTDGTPETPDETPKAPDETPKPTATPTPTDGTRKALATPKPTNGTPESPDETPEAPDEMSESPDGGDEGDEAPAPSPSVSFMIMPCGSYPELDKICGATDFPIECVKYISPFLNKSVKIDPVTVLKAGLAAADNLTRQALDTANKFMNDPKTKPKICSSLSVCIENYESIPDNCESALKAVEKRSMPDLKTALSADVTLANTCIDVYDKIKSPMKDMDSELLSLLRVNLKIAAHMIKF